jgi:hypothetical protein
MSYCPGRTLEDYLGWAFSLIVVDKDNMVQSDGWRATYAGQHVITTEQFAEIVALYESHREHIEYLLDEFDEDETGWRQYASSAFNDISPDADNKASVLIKSWNITPTESMWVAK